MFLRLSFVIREFMLSVGVVVRPQLLRSPKAGKKITSEKKHFFILAIIFMFRDLIAAF